MLVLKRNGRFWKYTFNGTGSWWIEWPYIMALILSKIMDIRVSMY